MIQHWDTPKHKEIYWVGTIGDGPVGNSGEIKPFVKESSRKGLKFVQKTNLSTQENMRVVRESYMACAIVGHWQQLEGYIPCRIFKNISYGQYGVTNSKAVFDLFDRKIVYDRDTRKLFHKAYDMVKQVTLQEQLELMDIVRDKHTYINRINLLLDFMQEVYNNACH